LSSLEVAFLLGVVVVVALGVGWWLSSTFLVSKQVFSRMYPISAYVDADGVFLLCVYSAGPHEFYGRWVLSVKSGRSVEVSLDVLVGRVVGVWGSLGESYTPGASPALILTTGGGSIYVFDLVVVPDVSLVSCG
jgi:hypothetical protein